MKKVGTLALCLVLVLCLTLTVRADNAASYVQNYSVVSSDGTCQVSLTVNIRLETAAERLIFPLPRNAQNIRVDNASVLVNRTDNAAEVDLTQAVSGYVGEITKRFEYTLPSVVSVVEDEDAAEKTKLRLELPLLSGFAYPVERMEFTVTLPSPVESNPKVYSGYSQNSVESYLDTVVNGSMVSGVLNQSLRDHETLFIMMDFGREAFSGVTVFQRTGNPEVVPMLICAGLALVYWLLFLRTFPVLRTTRKTPPDGATAGELGCRLTFAGADLTMLVLNWAQLGYLLIQLDDHGRVILHKRMEMGNERNLFEIRVFRDLFGNRRAIDGTGYQYARMCKKTAAMVPGERSMCVASSGNMRLFRWLNCASNVFCGLCFAMNLTSATVLRVLLAMVLMVLGAFSAWKMQESFYRLHLRGKRGLYIGLGFAGIWLLLGIAAGIFWIALGAVAIQLLAGLAAAYGGRRSEMGRQSASQILGLRHHLKHVSREELQHIQRSDPDYFFNMAPYALALGVADRFARQFGKRKFAQCPYLSCRVGRKLTAPEWMQLLEETAAALDDRHLRMDREKYAILHFGRG